MVIQDFAIAPSSNISCMKSWIFWWIWIFSSHFCKISEPRWLLF